MNKCTDEDTPVAGQATPRGTAAVVIGQLVATVAAVIIMAGTPTHASTVPLDDGSTTQDGDSK